MVLDAGQLVAERVHRVARLDTSLLARFKGNGNRSCRPVSRKRGGIPDAFQPWREVAIENSNLFLGETVPALRIRRRGLHNGKLSCLLTKEEH